MLTKEQAATVVQEACEQFRAILPIQQCWLYGSYARGDFDEESDIDILMTADADEETIHAKRQQMSIIASRLSLKYDITVSVTVKTSIEFNQRSGWLPYYRNVLTEGHAYAV